MTIFGWDASHYDSEGGRGPMDLAAAHSAGVQFFTHKVSEGTGFTDPRGAAILARAHSSGIPLLGAYHVLHTSNVNAQVDFFLSRLPSWWADGPFLVQLDVEHWTNDWPPPAAVTAWVSRFVQKTGGQYRPLVYASKGQYANTLLSVHAPLWNAAYPTSTARPLAAAYSAAGGDSGKGWVNYSGQMPALWQFTSNATVGSQRQCDVNAFRGTIDQLIALTRGVDMAGSLTEADQNFQITQVQGPDGTRGLLTTQMSKWITWQRTVDAEIAALKSAAQPAAPTLSQVQLQAIHDDAAAVAHAAVRTALAAAVEAAQ